MKRNIYITGTDIDYYKKLLKLYDDFDETPLYKKRQGTRIVNLKNLEDLDRKQGFLLMVTMTDLDIYLPNTIDYYEPDVYEVDRYTRKLFKNFQYVIIISAEEYDYGRIPFSNTYFQFANQYFDTEEGINILVDKLFEESFSKKEEKYTPKRNANIEKLHKYIQKKGDFFTTKEIMLALNVNEKWIQRYMRDMNKIYNNIGYNKKKRVWYKVKNNIKK